MISKNLALMADVNLGSYSHSGSPRDSIKRVKRIRMKHTNIPHGRITAAESKLWTAIGNHADQVTNRLCDEKGFAEFVGSLISDLNVPLLTHALQIARNDGNVTFELEKSAQKIMGDDNFFGVADAVALFPALRFSRSVLASLSVVPFTKDELKQRAGTHALVAVLPVTLQQMVTASPRLFDSSESRRGFDNAIRFHFKQLAPGWKLVRKERVRSVSDDLQPPHKIIKDLDLLNYIMGALLSKGTVMFGGQRIHVAHFSNCSGYMRVTQAGITTDALRREHYRDDDFHRAVEFTI